MDVNVKSMTKTFEQELLDRYNEKRASVLWRWFLLHQAPVDVLEVGEVYQIVLNDTKIFAEFQKVSPTPTLVVGNSLMVFSNMKVIRGDPDALILQQASSGKLVRITVSELGQKFALLKRNFFA